VIIPAKMGNGGDRAGAGHVTVEYAIEMRNNILLFDRVAD